MICLSPVRFLLMICRTLVSDIRFCREIYPDNGCVSILRNKIDDGHW